MRLKTIEFDSSKQSISNLIDEIANSIIAKIKLFVKRDVVMNQTVDLPIRFDRDLL